MVKATIILSGGQDSTTVAAIARAQYSDVRAITFDYGQRHSIEIDSAKAIAKALKFDHHEVITLDYLAGTSPLTNLAEKVSEYGSVDEIPEGVASTFVPSRNLVFLSIASNRAIAQGSRVLLTGVNQTDGSGYPDCRREFIDSVQDAISVGNYGHVGEFQIDTPLMHLSKAETVELAIDVLGAERFDEVFALTHTCYQGVNGGCGKCAACLLRDGGFVEAGVSDPIWKHRAA